MPRERVQDESSLYDVQVAWSPQQYVQVGIETADHRTILDHLLLAGLSEEQATKARALLGDMLNSDQLAEFTGLWATLSREGCNRLIRLIQRARDRAYGKDA